MRSLLTSVAVATLLLATSIQTAAAAYVDPGDYYPGITSHPEDMMAPMTNMTVPASPAPRQATLSHAHKELRADSHHVTAKS